MENLPFVASRVLTGYTFLQASSIYGESHVAWMTWDVHRITLLFIALNSAALPFQTAALNTPSLALKGLSLFSASAGAFLYYKVGAQPQKTKEETFNIEGLYLQNAFTFESVNISGSYAIYHEFPKSQIALQALIMALALQTVVALALDVQNHWLYLQLAGIGASFYQARKMEWIAISHTSPLSRGLILSPTFSYHALLPEVLIKNTEYTCSICYEPPDSYFCSNKHQFCKECLMSVFVKKMKEFALVLFASDRFEYIFTQRIRPYRFRLEKNELPCCPICREIPGHPYLLLEKGEIIPHREETPAKSNFWIYCYFIYSLAELAFATYQSAYPTLNLYRLATFLLPLDLMLVGLLHQSEAVKQELQTSIKDIPRRSLVIAVATSIALFIFALYRRNETIETDLTPLLKGKIPEGSFKELKISHVPPNIQYLLEAGCGAQFFITLSILSFSTHKKIFLLIALMHAFKIHLWMKTKWIFFQRSYEVGFSRYASSATPSFNIFVSNVKTLSSENNGLVNTLEAIYNHSTNFFKESKWSATKYIGQHTGTRERLVYKAQIVPQKWLHQGIDFFKDIYAIGGEAYSSRNGLGSLIVNSNS